MAFDYASLVATGAALITRFGQPVTLTVVANPSPVDNDKPWRIGPTDPDDDETAYSTTGVFLSYPVDKAASGGQGRPVGYEPGDMQCLLPGSLGVAPTLRHYITDAAGKFWSIENVETIAPSGVNVLHICQVRAWPLRSK